MWFVADDGGHIIDGNGNKEFLNEASQCLSSQPIGATLDWHAQSWLLTDHWLRPTSGTVARSKREFAADEHRFPALRLVAGLNVASLDSTLRILAITLLGVSALVWSLTLIAGNVVCRRALRPVTQMAQSARAMDVELIDHRLPVPSTADELEDLSRSFNSLLDRLHESFERQRRFTGDASHQLRTPLAGLLGQVEVALRRQRGADDYRQVLLSVQKQAFHLQQIVESLLYLARADAEAHLPDLQTVSASEILEQVLSSWQDHPRAADIRVDRESKGPLSIRIQPVLFKELLNILLENACKYTPSGTPVVLRLSNHDDLVQLVIEDHGPGMPPEDLAQVFQPFFRSPAARRLGISGVGLGLAIAQRLTKSFGGSLEAESEPGTGTRFIFSMPEVTEVHKREQPVPA
jgi:signal transduction histidine kinase